MESPTSKSIIFHTERLPKWTVKALDFLSKEKWIGQSGWYLAGGTALALQANNRKSVDLDFFTTEKAFEDSAVLSHFTSNKNWKLTMNRENTIYGELLGAKVSFIAYPFFIPKQEFIQYGTIPVLQTRDIAVMKIVAISQRGRKRDFFDLYWCAHHVEPLIEIIKRLKEQYPSVAHDYHHILKAIVYFNDAESDPTPELNFDVSWETVKEFFRKEIIVAMDTLIFGKV